MDQIHVDPEKLREFARVLKDYSKHAETSLANLNGQLGRLKTTWRDQEFEKFATHLRRTQERLRVFATETAKTIPQLEIDAEVLTLYQKTQMPD